MGTLTAASWHFEWVEEGSDCCVQHTIGVPDRRGEHRPLLFAQRKARVTSVPETALQWGPDMQPLPRAATHAARASHGSQDAPEGPPPGCLWKDLCSFACATCCWSWSNGLLAPLSAPQRQPGLAGLLAALLPLRGPHRLSLARLGLATDWLSSAAYVATSDGLSALGVPDPLAVAAGQTACCLVAVPASNMGQQLKARGGVGVGAAVASLLREQGLCGVFQGSGAAIRSQAPMITIMVCTYTALQDAWERAGRQGGQPGPRAAVAGGVAGAASVLGMTAVNVAGRSALRAVRQPGRLRSALLHQARAAAVKSVVRQVAVEMATSAVFFAVYELVHAAMYTQHTPQLGTAQETLRKARKGARTSCDVLRLAPTAASMTKQPLLAQVGMHALALLDSAVMSQLEVSPMRHGGAGNTLLSHRNRQRKRQQRDSLALLTG